MDKYIVSLTSRALRDLNDIYIYIAQTLLVSETALGLFGGVETLKIQTYFIWKYFETIPSSTKISIKQNPFFSSTLTDEILEA